MSTPKPKKITKCSGKFKFCWPWEDFTNGPIQGTSKAGGLGFYTYSNIKMERTRNTPIVRYGKKANDEVILNFCPWCGADYKKLKRIPE